MVNDGRICFPDKFEQTLTWKNNGKTKHRKATQIKKSFYYQKKSVLYFRFAF